MTDKDIIAICPRCGMRARIVSHRYDWDRDEDMAQLKCQCGKSEVPYLESRVVDVEQLPDPCVRETRFRVLIPENMDGDTWSKISRCLTAGWNRF